MRKLLKALGYTVEAFSSAADFLASPFLPTTSCLVADVQMPGMTGVELHKNLIDAGYEIPTILVTAYPDEVVRNRALKNEVVCYLSKPVDDEHLDAVSARLSKPGRHMKITHKSPRPAGRVNLNIAPRAPASAQS